MKVPVKIIHRIFCLNSECCYSIEEASVGCTCSLWWNVPKENLVEGLLSGMRLEFHFENLKNFDTKSGTLWSCWFKIQHSVTSSIVLLILSNLFDSKSDLAKKCSKSMLNCRRFYEIKSFETWFFNFEFFFKNCLLRKLTSSFDALWVF